MSDANIASDLSFPLESNKQMLLMHIGAGSMRFTNCALALLGVASSN
jgi:hypothetical protein